MSITFKNTEIEDLIIIEPHMFPDDRGLYKKYYEKEVYKAAGIVCDFTESSDIYSYKGTLRGLHYQNNYSQAKLLHVISGSIYDVALDLRKKSKTFGKYHTELLRAEDNKILFIPEGFAHGFITLSESAIFSYQCSGKYDPASCGGILWNDSELKIPWPLEEYGIQNIICTEKDRTWPTFSEYCEMLCLGRGY